MEKHTDTQVQTNLSDSPDGVAPQSGLSDPTPTAGPETRTCDWLCHHKTGWQYGEQGVLAAIIDAIDRDLPDEHRWCVEFGAGDGMSLPLTCERVMRREGWRALLIEGDPEKHAKLARRVPPLATVVNAMVKIDGDQSIDAHMARAGCPGTPALMVIDIDSSDFHVAQAMKARPAVLCIEHMDMACPRFNDGEPFCPILEDAGKPFTVPGSGGVWSVQANTKAMDMMVPGLGYTLVFRTRVNSVYVRNDMIDKVAKAPDGKVRLNVGAGDHSDRRYTSIDIKDGIDARKLPYADASVDEVYSSHLLEHFGVNEVDEVLREWARVLKPGGIVRVAVPDAMKLAQKVLASDEIGPNDYRMLEMMVCGAHSEPNDKHASIFTPKNLRERMNRAGFGFAQEFDPFIIDDCSNYDISLNIEAVKRHWPKIEKPRVCLVLNQPRFTFTGHEVSLLELARKLDIEIQTCCGSFWDRDMTTATKVAIQRFNPDFLFYSDYDSVFEVEDIKKLLDAINADPSMAAIHAVQMSRHDDRPLVFEAHRDYSKPITKVDFAHFGGTFVRREVFEEMEQPWFWSIPGKDANGKWDWDTWSRTDADITFWRNLKALGFNVYLHTEVSIGHIVQAVKYPRDSGRGVQLIPMENYWRTGKPKDAVFNPDLYKPKVVVPEDTSSAARGAD